jgi:16S rRNA (adenine1518-N6/adenine1519-N6)-dimethyltransferase
VSHGRRPSKPPHGQNYLVNEGVARAIAEAAAPTGTEHVLEIGPGRGALTRPLLERVRRLVAVEIDALTAARLAAELKDDPRFTLVRGDVLALSWEELLAAALRGGLPGTSVRVVSNLPYDVGTAIVLRYLEHCARDPSCGDAVFMLQREVAERMTSAPGHGAYGSLAALARCTHEVRALQDVAPGSFRPVPRVSSQVIALTRRAAPLFPLASWAEHAAFIHRAFAHRRKQLAGVLAASGSASRDAWRERLEALRCAPTCRADELTPAQLVALAGLGD